MQFEPQKHCKREKPVKKSSIKKIPVLCRCMDAEIQEFTCAGSDLEKLLSMFPRYHGSGSGFFRVEESVSVLLPVVQGLAGAMDNGRECRANVSPICS